MYIYLFAAYSYRGEEIRADGSGSHRRLWNLTGNIGPPRLSRLRRPARCFHRLGSPIGRLDLKVFGGSLFRSPVGL